MAKFHIRPHKQSNHLPQRPRDLQRQQAVVLLQLHRTYIQNRKHPKLNSPGTYLKSHQKYKYKTRHQLQ